MGNYSNGKINRESRRESRQRALRVLAYVGLGALAVATAVVVVMALRG
ncbi:hypothetical protein [Arthrobacter sp. ISL-5]|nr:hypothetical protein [Arthrobacter sp. ISL-5]MBT2552807.1 hypothetical protein [Arthrobacter sp. ISL-5]